MSVQVQEIPRVTDLSTHEGMASELTALLTQANLQIPIQKAKDMVEILNWLEAISNGELRVEQVTKQ